MASVLLNLQETYAAIAIGERPLSDGRRELTRRATAFREDHGPPKRLFIVGFTAQQSD
jgi:hypothetical protein